MHRSAVRKSVCLSVPSGIYSVTHSGAAMTRPAYVLAQLCEADALGSVSPYEQHRQKGNENVTSALRWYSRG